MSGEAEGPEHGWLIHKAGRGWYRPNAQGYTNDTAQAGRYSHEEALSYSHPNGWKGPRDGMTIIHEDALPAALPPYEKQLRKALEDMTATPYQIMWLYVRAARERHKGNLTHTARAIGVHRRTLQRLLQSKMPPRVEG
jgi:DNA-binding NtrC family response regulator